MKLFELQRRHNNTNQCCDVNVGLYAQLKHLSICLSHVTVFDSVEIRFNVKEGKVQLFFCLFCVLRLCSGSLYSSDVVILA